MLLSVRVRVCVCPSMFRRLLACVFALLSPFRFASVRLPSAPTSDYFCGVLFAQTLRTPVSGSSMHDLWSECLPQTAQSVINSTVAQQRHNGSSSDVTFFLTFLSSCLLLTLSTFLCVFPLSLLSPSVSLQLQVLNISVSLNFVYRLKINVRDLIAFGLRSSLQG